MNEEAFKKLWVKYPRKLGTKKARQVFAREIRNQQDYNRITKALQNYLNNIKKNDTEIQFIQHGSTWFNNWEDWKEYEEKGLMSNVDELTREMKGG